MRKFILPLLLLFGLHAEAGVYTNKQAFDITNLGLSTAVAANALTITATTKAGATPTPGNPAYIAFRSSTATTGTNITRSITSGLSITIPSGASVGHTASMNQHVLVYALDDAGTVDLCISGVNYFSQASVQSTTQISSGATSGTVLYCASSHSGSKAIRLVGRLIVNEAATGTWNSAPSDVQVNPVMNVTVTEWASFTPSFVNAITWNTGSGYISPSGFWRRNGQDMLVRMTARNGASGGASGSGNVILTVPNSLILNTSILTDISNPNVIIGRVGTDAFFDNSGGGFLNYVVSPVTATTLGLFNAAGSAFAVTSIDASDGLTFILSMPILGWSTYGP